jgi:hypothetical protein
MVPDRSDVMAFWSKKKKPRQRPAVDRVEGGRKQARGR